MLQKKKSENPSKKIENLSKKNLRFAQKKISNSDFFFCKPSQWFSIFGFCGRMPAGRKSRRMYCRRPLPGLIGTLEFEENKSKIQNKNSTILKKKIRESEQKKIRKTVQKKTRILVLQCFLNS